jgi:hypothetical protein
MIKRELTDKKDSNLEEAIPEVATIGVEELTVEEEAEPKEISYIDQRVPHHHRKFKMK